MVKFELNVSKPAGKKSSTYGAWDLSLQQSAIYAEPLAEHFIPNKGEEIKDLHSMQHSVFTDWSGCASDTHTPH